MKMWTMLQFTSNVGIYLVRNPWTKAAKQRPIMYKNVHELVTPFLCCDDRDDFGIIKFDEYKQHIFPEARAVGIATQPFDPDLMRPRDRSTTENCKRIVLLLVDYLTNNFPNISVTIRNSANDTLPLTWARLIMANQTIISLSSFGIFPCIGTFGQGYFQRGNSGVKRFNVHIPDILNSAHLMVSPVLTRRNGSLYRR